jgi:hypothetical protein
MAKRVLGLDAKLYRNTGDYASPVWVELTNCKNVSRKLEKGESDVTTRGNNGWTATAGTLKSLEVSFEMVYDPEDANYTAIESAFFDNEVIEVAIMDGDIAVDGTRGVRCSVEVFNFEQKEDLTEAIMVDVTLKPTYAANAPERMTISI